MNLERLAAAVAEAEIPSDGKGLAKALDVLDRLTAKVSAAIGAFDAGGEWAADFAVSAVSWLQGQGMARRAAASAVSTARRLRELPITSAAWLDGLLCGGQVQAIVANVDDRTLPQFVAQEAALVPTLVPLSVLNTTRAMRFWRARAEALVDDGEEPRLPEREVRFSQAYRDRWALDGDLDPEGGAVLATALRLATTDDGEGEPTRTPVRRRADALVDIARFYLDHRGRTSTGRERPHLNVVVDWRDLTAGAGGELVEGGYVDGATIRRLLCDAAVHRVVTDGGSAILDYGTTTRTVPPALWAALVLRDRHCRLVPGCDRPSEWCEAHHVVPVVEGGPTNLANLILGCSRHHHLVHTPGWQLELLPDGTLVTTDPGGRTRTMRPPGVVQRLVA